MKSIIEKLDLLYERKYIETSKKRAMSLLDENKDNIIAYIRVANLRNCEEFIKRQKDIIENFCKTYNIKFKATYVDEGFSGLNFDRPGIKKIIEEHKEDIILVCDEARISRDYFNFLDFTDKIKVIAINSLIDK